MSIARRGATGLALLLALELVAPPTSEAAESQAGQRAGPGSAGVPRITATEVVGPNGERLVPQFLNERGQVVAQVDDDDRDPQGQVVFWERGTATFVEPGAAQALATDLSDRGHIVGFAGRDAFIWRRGQWRALSAADAGGGIAYAVNDRGQVAGLRHPEPGSVGQPVVWQGDGVTVAPVATTGRPAPVDMNDRGQVLLTVQSLDRPDRSTTLLWQVGGGVTDLGNLGEPHTSAADINDRGQVVGYSQPLSTGFRAFLWEDGRMTDLGNLGGPPGYDQSRAVDINEHGDVVGWSFTNTDSPESHAVLWKDGEIIDLGTLGGEISEATAINDRGQVVGFSQTEDGQMHPFLWEDGRMTDLATVVAEPNLGRFSHAIDINNRGQILGFITTGPDSGPFVQHTVLWTTHRR